MLILQTFSANRLCCDFSRRQHLDLCVFFLTKSGEAPETPDSRGSLRQTLDQRRLLVIRLFHEKGYYPEGELFKNNTGVNTVVVAVVLYYHCAS